MFSASEVTVTIWSTIHMPLSHKINNCYLLKYTNTESSGGWWVAAPHRARLRIYHCNRRPRAPLHSVMSPADSRKGLMAPQNNFLEKISKRFKGQRKLLVITIYSDHLWWSIGGWGKVSMFNQNRLPTLKLLVPLLSEGLDWQNQVQFSCKLFI